MNVITIPRKISGAKDDLVLLPRKEYELLVARPNIREVSPTKMELKALRVAEKRFAAGKFYSLADVKRDLARRRRH